MKITLSITTLIIFFTFSGFSQNKTDANIFGHVVDKKSGEHILFHNISIKGTTIGVTTDATGHYFLKNLPEGNHILVASGLGYKTLEKPVNLRPGNSIEINFEIEQDVFELNSVIVSANRNETNRRESPSIVNLITPKLFENTNSVCLAQGLNFQPGLRVETNCQNWGFSQVRINGLDGPYSQILIDSRPVFSSLAGIYGLEQIPANMIERVEVIRGGGSALYGSSAIAGIINIITKEPTANSITLSNTTNLIYGKKADFNTSFNASIVSDDYKTGVMFFGATRQRSPFDYDDDGFTEITRIDMKNLGFRAFYKPGLHSKITLEYHNIGEFRRGGNNLHLPAHKSDIAEQLDHNINTGGIKYDIFSNDFKHKFNLYSSAQLIDRKSYYGSQQDTDAHGKTSNTTFVSGAQYTYAMDTLFLLPAELTIGAEFNSDQIKDEMPGYNRIFDQKVNIISFFLQNEWQTSRMSILIGGRIDKHNLVKNAILSPRLNLRYNPIPNLGMRASVSTGFRAPQSFDEDLHISILGGDAALVQPDPDLQTEKSLSYSASIDYNTQIGDVEMNVLAEGFFTRLDNVFVLEESGRDINNNIILEKRNGAGSVVKGINLEGMLVPAKKILLQFGMTFQTSEYREPEKWSDNENIKPQKRMFRTPGQYGFFTANYEISKPLKLSLSGTYTGSMLVQHFAGYIENDTEKETPGFFDINSKLTYDFKIGGNVKLQLNGGIQNILNSYQDDFDKGKFRDASYIYGPSLPRTYFIGMKLMI
ncbi:MAG: TonB-dependent receptor [Deltaproteobacteria bacterium]